MLIAYVFYFLVSGILDFPEIFEYKLVRLEECIFYPMPDGVVYWPWIESMPYWPVLREIIYWHWHYRKKYETFLYKFNAYHFLNVKKRHYFNFAYYIEYHLVWLVNIHQRKIFLICFLQDLGVVVVLLWYYTAWTLWILLTYFLYFHEMVRDLGPSYDIYDYNPEDDMGVYLTVGPTLLVVWASWTYVANTVFTKSIVLLWYHVSVQSTSWFYWNIWNAHCISMYWSVFF